MSNADRGNWRVKDAKGRISGPFSTDEILSRIDKNLFIGDEFVAVYPDGRWIPISQAPEFYDRLLDALAKEGESPESAPKNNQKNTQKQKTEEANTSEEESTAVIKGAPSSKSTSSFTPPPQLELTAPNEDVKTSTARRSVESLIESVIELKDMKWLERQEKLKKSRGPLLVIAFGLILVGLALMISPGGGSSEKRIRLVAPRPGQSELAQDRVSEKFRRALGAFYADTFSGYQRSQNELVEAVEGMGSRTQAGVYKVELLSLLCLSYRELWPFAYQDARDLKTVTSIMQEAKRLDPGGLHGRLCEVIQLLLSGRYRDAQGLTETMLLEENRHPAIFEIRGEIYFGVRDDVSAANYFSEAKNLWPAWQKSYVQEAKAKTRLGQFLPASQLLRTVLSSVPTHAIAKIELGSLEGMQFNQFEKAIELLKSGLEDSDRITQVTESGGYLSLAKIYLKRNSSQRALEYARRAFALYSGNIEAKQMIVDLGGESAVAEVRGRGGECMYLGDQHVKAGDCYSAQAEYRACYEADKKNAVAAMKTGKCLWQLGQTQEAIEWLNKATSADMNLTAAHVELADYHAQRHDFATASTILSRVLRAQPQSYEVYRGFALLELRRGAFKSSASFAQRALKIYDNDIETLLIMAKAQLGMQAYQEAQRYAARAIEMDFNNTEAHSVYSKVEASLNGVDMGARYLQQQINRYVITRGQQIPPAAIEYRIALGELYMRDERFRQAEEAVRQAVALDPRNKKALVLLGKVLQALSSNSEALEKFLQAAVLDPSDAEPIFLSGNLYADSGKLPEATRQFERVLKINPRYPRAHTSLGRIALRQRDPKKALEQAMQERGINPELVDSFILAAEAFFGMKQYLNCAGEYQKAVVKRGQNAQTYVKMARCYRLAGALDSASSLLRQAIAIESGYPDTYKEQGAIYHSKGMADEAIAAYDTYLSLAPNTEDRDEIQARIRRVQAGDMSFKD